MVNKELPELYCFARPLLEQDLLGDLIPKGEKCGIKARYFLKEKKHIPKGEKYLSVF